MSAGTITFRFWGVRGSIASPGPSTVRYGGNTPCVEIRAGGRLIVFDGGTGLRELGLSLVAQEEPIEADLFLTHLHWDHIQGIPFFSPAFEAGHTFRIHGERKGEQSLKTVLEGQMTDPNFPVPLSVMACSLSFNEIIAGTTVELGPDLRVRTAPLNHPNGCMGLRLEYAGGSLVFITDTEHDAQSGTLDPQVLNLAKDADVLIYDAMYTEAEYRNARVGWGHSTYREALRIARAAGVGTLYFFHHDPTHTDDFLDERLAEARAETVGESLHVEMAREGIEQVV